MQITDFLIEPAMCVPGDEVTISFTVQTESNDTIGENGLYVWVSLSSGSEASAYRDSAFAIGKGETRTVTAKTKLLSDRSFSRGTVLSAFGVQLGQYGSRVNVSFPITMLNARYSPSISLFQLERAVNGVPNDEGENLLADMLLGKSADGVIADMRLRLYYQSGSMATTASSSIDLTSRISTLLAGVTGSAGIIGRTFSKSRDWYFLLVFGDEYESVQAGCMVARAFANMHLSGRSTGGVCFGGFSSAAEGKPLLESHYPAHLYGGVEEIGDGWTYLTPILGATPGEHGGGLLRCRAIEKKRIIAGSLLVQPQGSECVLAQLPDGFAPAASVFCFNACDGARIACIGVMGGADTNAGKLTLKWVRNLSGGSLYTDSAIWVQCAIEYWVD